MDQADHRPDRVNKINRATIGDVNAKAYARPLRDQAIITFKAVVRGNHAIDNRDAISMDLLCGNKRRSSEPMMASNIAMNAVQPRKRLYFVVRHLDARHPEGETVNDLGQRAQRRELFSRKLTVAHLLDVVVRVVRVVLV
jgi:hypothetical protein